MAGTILSAESLREVLDYCPDSGEFTWKVYRGRCAKVGSKAGTLKPTGYVAIILFGKWYGAHRLAWLHVHGAWPNGDIDHINGCPSDNRIANLRDVSKNMNM